jgi:hypothetical protein
MRNIGGNGDDAEFQFDENDERNGGFNQPGIGPGMGAHDAFPAPSEGGGETSGKEGTGYSPRENFLPGGGAGSAGITSTPKKPSTPDIRSGEVSNYGGDRGDSGSMGGHPPSGVIPFPPMGGGGANIPPIGPIGGGPIGQPGGGRSSLFGRIGGLQGGGLGAPGAAGSGYDTGDTTDIGALIASLMRKKQGLF